MVIQFSSLSMSWLVSWGRGWVVGLGLGVLGDTLVADVSDVSTIGISDTVGDDLGAAVGKGNTVLAVGGIAVPGLVLAEVGARVAVLNTVLVVVGSGLIISGLLVGRGRLVGSRGISWGGGSGVSIGNSREGSDGNEDLKNAKQKYNCCFKENVSLNQTKRGIRS